MGLSVRGVAEVSQVGCVVCDVFVLCNGGVIGMARMGRFCGLNLAVWQSWRDG